MPRTGQPAYDAGMRGKEKPKHESKPPDRGKSRVNRITIESAENGGHILTVDRHQKPGKTNEPAMPYAEPEKHAHSDKASAHAHVGELMDQMGKASD